MARSDPLDSRQGPGKTEGQQRGRVQKGCAGTTVGDQRLEWRPVRSPPKRQSRVLFLGLPGAASLLGETSTCALDPRIFSIHAQQVNVPNTTELYI